jgi:hypothetical protein
MAKIITRQYTDPKTGKSYPKQMRVRDDYVPRQHGGTDSKTGQTYTESFAPQPGLASTVARGIAPTAAATAGLGGLAALGGGLNSNNVNASMGKSLGAFGGNALAIGGNAAASYLNKYAPESKAAAIGAGSMSTAGNLFSQAQTSNLGRGASGNQAAMSGLGAGIQGLAQGALGALPGGTSLSKGAEPLMAGIHSAFTGGGFGGLVRGISEAGKNILASKTLGADAGEWFKDHDAKDYAMKQWGQNSGVEDMSDEEQQKSKEAAYPTVPSDMPTDYEGTIADWAGKDNQENRAQQNKVNTYEAAYNTAMSNNNEQNPNFVSQDQAQEFAKQSIGIGLPQPPTTNNQPQAYKPQVTPEQQREQLIKAGQGPQAPGGGLFGAGESKLGQQTPQAPNPQVPPPQQASTPTPQVQTPQAQSQAGATVLPAGSAIPAPVPPPAPQASAPQPQPQAPAPQPQPQAPAPPTTNFPAPTYQQQQEAQEKAQRRAQKDKQAQEFIQESEDLYDSDMSGFDTDKAKRQALKQHRQDLEGARTYRPLGQDTRGDWTFGAPGQRSSSFFPSPNDGTEPTVPQQISDLSEDEMDAEVQKIYDELDGKGSGTHYDVGSTQELLNNPGYSFLGNYRHLAGYAENLEPTLDLNFSNTPSENNFSDYNGNIFQRTPLGLIKVGNQNGQNLSESQKKHARRVMEMLRTYNQNPEQGKPLLNLAQKLYNSFPAEDRGFSRSGDIDRDRVQAAATAFGEKKNTGELKQEWNKILENAEKWDIPGNQLQTIRNLYKERKKGLRVQAQEAKGLPRRIAEGTAMLATSPLWGPFSLAKYSVRKGTQARDQMDKAQQLRAHNLAQKELDTGQSQRGSLDYGTLNTHGKMQYLEEKRRLIGENEQQALDHENERVQRIQQRMESMDPSSEQWGRYNRQLQNLKKFLGGHR